MIDYSRSLIKIPIGGLLQSIRVVHINGIISTIYTVEDI